MIARYSRPEMLEIWQDKCRYEIWLQIELLAMEAMANEGLLPQEAYLEVKKKAGFDYQRIQEIEEDVKHDVIAFLTNVAEKAGSSARFMHRGMTSSDVLDTAFAVQLKRSAELIHKGLNAAAEAIKIKALQYKSTPCIGRSHGMHAEPTTFGLKLIGWYAELRRQEARIKAALPDIAVGKISGAVGTYASVSPAVEKHVLSAIGLEAETVATQIVQRDRHAYFFSILAGLAGSIEKFCVEIRHLQRSEVRELEEPFASQQKGSSAMPHKKNPILAENLCGLARLLRGYAGTSLENVALWHERDISHSGVERVIAPDMCILLDFMLHRFTKMIEGLVVHPDRMRENLEMTNGLPFSGTLLIALADAGMKREDAYRVVQKHALAALDGGPGLFERVRTEPEITSLLGEEKLKEIFDIRRHLQHVDLIFDRALKSAC